jgi:hypothetical protein
MHDLRPNQRVPEGVDAQSWLGFEHRIGQRRFAALVTAADKAVADGDLTSAQAAFDEARELCPDAPELLRLESTIAATTAPDLRLWPRAAGAVALLVVGVAMVMGLEFMQRATDEPEVVTTLRALEETAAPGASVAMSVLAVTETPAASKPDESPVVAQSSRAEDPPRAVERSSAGEPSRRREPPQSNRPSPIPSRTVPPPIIKELPRANRPAPASASAPRLNPGTVGVRPLETNAAVATVGPNPIPPVAQSSPTDVETAPAVPAPRTPSAPSRPAAPPAPARLTNASADDQSQVADVLRQYARAYEALDANAARDVWPSVDRRALARAFENLRSQQLSLQDCEIDVRGATANASCRGQAQYVGKVGGGEPRIEPRTWRFELRREGEAWKIANAEARRPTS